MKIRIRGNSVRLRLTKTEVAELAQQKTVEEKTDFGGGNCLIYAISASFETSIVKAVFTNNRLEIFLPVDEARNWAKNDEVGISAEQKPLKILIEKDFNCLIPRNTQEDADTYPHPKATDC